MKQFDTPSSAASQQTQASMLCDRIRADIIRGDFQPGMKLKIAGISARYGVGSIPVREALSRLANSGFVDSRDQRGFAVRAVSSAELMDITRVRLLIEAAALRESIELGDYAWEARLIGALHAHTRFPVYSDADRRVIGREWEAAHDSLHRELLSGCQSPWLIKLTDELRDQATRYRHISAAASNSPSRNVVAEHTAIVEAAISRKVELAVALLCEHISTSTTIAVSEFPSNEKPAKSKLTGLLPRAPKVVGAPTEAHSSTV